MRCVRCDSERLFQFEAAAAPRERPGPEELPSVCRSCGLISVGGKELRLPAEIEQAAKTLAEAAQEAASNGRSEMEAMDPTAAIEGYMSKFYQRAYLDGFVRCLAFFRHNAKEGRIRRMRELWGEGKPVGGSTSSDGMLSGMMWPMEAYTEFEQLLHLSVAPGESDVPSTSN